MSKPDVFATISNDELTGCTGGNTAVQNSPAAQGHLTRHNLGVQVNGYRNIERSGVGSGGGGGGGNLMPLD